MRFLSPILLVFFLFLFISSHASQNLPIAQSTNELKKQLEQTLQEFHVPGLSVAIVHRDGPEWIEGIGLADVSNQCPVTATTRFRIGSISKAFAALAILQLVEEGKLSLNNRVRNLVPEVWFENKWENTNPIRIVHLLEHTTGWDDCHFREYAKDDATIDLLNAFEYDHTSRISRWQPGTRMAYCNSGPAVAAYIVEKITGKSFEEYVEYNLFRPMGMKTATYFQTNSDLTMTYHPDGVTRYPYWNFIMRSSGSINASAQDMAAYLLFYLNRGNVNGKQIVSGTTVDRMEIPTSTWGAKEGMKVGYGLSNYYSIYDGFVYHGHYGNLEGALTELAYMPESGIGYFYSINSTQSEAFLKIGTQLRSYITQKLSRPPVPPPAELPSNASEYTGWYEPDSPRLELAHFLERLLGIAYIHFKDGKLLISSIGKFNALYLPVDGMQFRRIPEGEFPDPIPSVALLQPNEEGRFIQIGIGIPQMMKNIPAWYAISEIGLILFVCLSILSVLLYAPIWLLSALRRTHRFPAEHALRIWPLVAAFTLIVMGILIISSSTNFIARFGQLTSWSLALFLDTLIFAIASLTSVISLWRVPSEGVRHGMRVYSMIVTLALMIATTYFAYWGIIGLRSWT